MVFWWPCRGRVTPLQEEGRGWQNLQSGWEGVRGTAVREERAAGWAGSGNATRFWKNLQL